nr:hypothetical protein [Tanacetum cinerariifolium]
MMARRWQPWWWRLLVEFAGGVKAAVGCDDVGGGSGGWWRWRGSGMVDLVVGGWCMADGVEVVWRGCRRLMAESWTEMSDGAGKNERRGSGG